MYIQRDPTKNNWHSQVRKDLVDFGMDYLNMDDIKNMSKFKFKNILKEKCKDAALKYLLENNENKSKMVNLKYYQLEMQEYLKSNKISTTRKKILFKFRTRMINVGQNYGNKKCCPLCKQHDDTQQHMLDCFMMKLHCQEIYKTEHSYNDIFNLTRNNLVNISKLCESIIRTREILMQ